MKVLRLYTTRLIFLPRYFGELPLLLHTYINTNKPNGTYSGSVIVWYEKNGQWSADQFITYSITLTGNSNLSDQSGTITVDKTNVSTSLSRINAQSGFIYGDGFTITSQGATGWLIYNNEPTQGQGFYESSGGISPGSSSNIRTYILF